MTEFIEIMPYALIAKNVISNPEKIIEKIKERNSVVPWNDALEHSLPGVENCIFEDFDRSTIITDSTLLNLYESMRKVFLDYISYYDIENRMTKPLYTGNYSVKEYPVESSLGIHRDYGIVSDFNQEQPCSITINAYLSSNFEGGELALYDNTPNVDAPELAEGKWDLEPIHLYKPEAGDAVIFPSVFLHSVNEITQGTRYGVNIRLKESAPPSWWNGLVELPSM